MLDVRTSEVVMWYEDGQFHVTFPVDEPPIDDRLPSMTQVQMAAAEIASNLNAHPEHVTVLASKFLSRLGGHSDDTGRARQEGH